MGISKAGERFVFVCELCQLVDHLNELSLYYFKCITHDYDICVVANIA